MSSDPGSSVSKTVRGALERQLQERTIPIALKPRETLTPERSALDPDEARAVELFRQVGASEGALEIMATIGEGGMGIVRAARQLTLGREVALKTLRDASDDPVSTLTLLREAWITGSLEHPNVVPVYDLSVDAAGKPQIVLKKIEGAAWSDLLRSEAEVHRRFGAHDALDWHLRTLMQVANALHFAHSRGIVHRDVKPDNVMVGKFGEVYVLDWGVAVSLVDDGSGRLPLAQDAVEIAGTPAYMAPEMLGGQAGRLGVRTDVYLLGSVLYEIVAGHPPHDGKSIAEIIGNVLGPPRDLPESVPPELVRIVRTAMAFEPEGRFPDADAFRVALTEFLEHRGSLALTRDADERLRALDAQMSAAAPDGETLRVRMYRLFAEARMGYSQALRAWPGNERARIGLRRAVESMVAHELSAGDSRAASVLLSELPDVDPALQARVERTREKEEREERRRTELEADLDPELGRSSRLVAAGLLCALWTITPLTMWLLDVTDVYHRTHRDLLWGAFVSAAFAGGLAYWAREALSRTAVNRRLRASVAIALGAQISLVAASSALHIDFWSTAALKFLIYTVVIAHVSVSVSRYFWIAVGAYLVAFALACTWPRHGFLFEGLSNIVLTFVVFALWGRGPSAGAAAGATAWGPSSFRKSNG